MTEEEQVDAYRVRFRLGPVGSWHHADGRLYLNDCWYFRPDGTGVYYDNDVTGSLRTTSNFKWHSIEDRTISCLITETDMWLEAGTSWEEEWQTIHYDFKIVQTECGAQVAMYTIVEDIVEDSFGVEVGNGSWSAYEPVILFDPQN